MRAREAEVHWEHEEQANQLEYGHGIEECVPLACRHDDDIIDDGRQDRADAANHHARGDVRRGARSRVHHGGDLHQAEVAEGRARDHPEARQQQHQPHADLWLRPELGGEQNRAQYADAEAGDNASSSGSQRAVVGADGCGHTCQHQRKQQHRRWGEAVYALRLVQTLEDLRHGKACAVEGKVHNQAGGAHYHGWHAVGLLEVAHERLRLAHRLDVPGVQGLGGLAILLVQVTDRVQCGCVVAALGEERRALRQEEGSQHAHERDSRRAAAPGQAPLQGGHPLQRGALAHHHENSQQRSEAKSDGREGRGGELVALRGDLVQQRNRGRLPQAEAQANHEVEPRDCQESVLEGGPDAAEHGDEVGQDDGPLPAHPVGQRPREHVAQQGPAKDGGDDDALGALAVLVNASFLNQVHHDGVGEETHEQELQALCEEEATRGDGCQDLAFAKAHVLDGLLDGCGRAAG
eukprot:CAMPEP_0195112348 /NCGR_PEP_ID=MMETSP0448-20130528/98838_1 /TAXON_ID=66468 /ORGANISM="Heterocapsa triquestra, Strain CCMP 448" /LENGTH=463 /DNA_ID=CAMNT_0040149197 /DNA_START=30 /DNA_END=1417 /DNA_ORIENTATION=+